jgi:hemolysin activation/secretion protein
MKNQTTLVATLTLSMLASSVAFAAPVAPDAGQTIRELQPLPEMIAPGVVSPLQSAEPAQVEAVVSAAEEVTVDVTAIHVTGSRGYLAADLEALVADLVGSEHTLPELEAAAARITAFYRSQGYVVAQAYLPQQDIVDGSVTINVLEGALGQTLINNQSRLSDARATADAATVKTGDAVQAEPVDRMLLLLSDTIGVGGVRASLQPGASVGTTDLLIELDPAKPYAASVEVDNYGNRYTGENRIGGSIALNSPLKMGDQLTLRAVASDLNMQYAQLSYRMPVGVDGLKVGVSFSDTTYKLGKEFAPLLADGTATSASVFATYPLIRSQMSNLYGTLTYENKKLTDKTGGGVNTTNKTVDMVSLGLSGNHMDALLGGGMSAYDATFTSGNLSMDAASMAVDAASARSNGAFTKVGYNLNRQQHMTAKDTVSLAFSGQQTDSNLASSEKMYLGGVNAVRAYPQGEAGGDDGWLMNAEVRHTLMDKVQGVAFYDAGSVSLNHNAYVAGAVNTRSLAGAGVGVNAQYGWAQLKTSVAWRTTGGAPQSIPSTVNSSPMIWAQLAGQL